MSEVVEFCGITRLGIPADRVMARASEAGLSAAVVLGYDADGEFYFASSYAAGPEILWLLELAKKTLLEVEVDG